MSIFFHFPNTVFSPLKPIFKKFMSLLTLSQMKNLDSSKLKEFADDNVKFNEIGRKFSKRIENTVGKGEIVSNFSFSNSVFKRLVLQTCKNQGLFGNG